MEKVIKIEGLYKEYKLGVVGRGTLYRDLQSWWARIRKKEDPNSVIGRNNDYLQSKKSFLALDDVNLEIEKGEAVTESYFEDDLRTRGKDWPKNKRKRLT